MAQSRQTRLIKMVRLEVTVSPIHDKKIMEEIKDEESRGRIITKSDIIREELDARYSTKLKKSDS